MLGKAQICYSIIANFRIIRLLITCAFQMTIMRRFEKMIGCVRLALIYFVSGIGGYLASASFVPYMVN